jgi:hypothetical protein
VKRSGGGRVNASRSGSGDGFHGRGNENDGVHDVVAVRLGPGGTRVLLNVHELWQHQRVPWLRD